MKNNHRLGAHSEGGTHVSGNRFEADVSRNTKWTDIKDRRGNKVITLLNAEDLQELRDLATHLLEMMS